MGFKNSGFPHYGFNPLGFRTSGGLLQDLIKNCGLISANQPEIDKVGKQSRTAYRNKGLKYSAGTYIKNLEFANQPLTYYDLVTELEVNTNFDAQGEFLIPVNSVGYLNTSLSSIDYVLNVNSRQSDGIIPANGLNGTVKLFEQFLSPDPATEENIAVESQQDSQGVTVAIRNEIDNYDFSDGTNEWTSNFATFDVNDQVATITSLGALNFTQFRANNNNDAFIIGKKYFVFAKVRSNNANIQNISIRNTNTVIKNIPNPIVGTWYDLYELHEPVANGSFRINSTETVAMISSHDVEGNIERGGGVFSLDLLAIDEILGTNYASMTAEQINAIKYDLLDLQLWLDENLTILADTGTPIACDASGKLFAWISDGQSGSIRPTADSVGRIKYDLVKCDISGTPNPSGLYIRRDQLYFDESYTDYWYTAGVPNIIEIATIPNIYKNQIIISEDKQEIYTYKEPLTEGSECLYKALKVAKLNEAYQVQTSESSGVFEQYNVDEGPFYVVKEGLVIE